MMKQIRILISRLINPKGLYGPVLQETASRGGFYFRQRVPGDRVRCEFAGWE